MPKRTKSYETDLHERLTDPAYAMEYLRAALEDDEEGADAVFLLALRDVAQANRMICVAEATGLNRESLYRMLSRKGNPGINSLKAVLSAVGLRLSVEAAIPKNQTAMASQLIARWSRPDEPCGFSYDELLFDPQPCEAGREFLGKPPPTGMNNFHVKVTVSDCLIFDDNFPESRRDSSSDCPSVQV
jgi:probable addiction module antidote protein